MNAHLQFGIKQCDCFPFENRRVLTTSSSQRVKDSRHFSAQFTVIPGFTGEGNDFAGIEFGGSWSFALAGQLCAPRLFPTPFTQVQAPNFKMKELDCFCPVHPFSSQWDIQHNGVFPFPRAWVMAKPQQQGKQGNE